jgi:hypothetical protein
MDAAFPAYDDIQSNVVTGEQHVGLIAAAAIRAAADQLSYQLPFEDYGRVDVVDLLSIATELEGHA